MTETQIDRIEKYEPLEHEEIKIDLIMSNSCIKLLQGF